MLSCILLIPDHAIFLVLFGANKHLQSFSRTINCNCLMGLAQLCWPLKKMLVIMYFTNSVLCKYLDACFSNYRSEVIKKLGNSFGSIFVSFLEMYPGEICS